ncbi:rhomboid family intramembrane serine protease [Ktedonobacteria bacterium brp13]|nr:rhomboid family intramembrane serine protease [Ktedonobacteria bacterium brp13]
MEAHSELQTYLDQGKQELAHGHGREAAIAYAHGAQIDTDDPMVHLGLAEANLALGNYDVVKMACRKVQELQPQGGFEGWTAQAILDLLDQRYDRALQSADKVIELDPSIGYTHALRSYLLRATGQDYDANLARARATRMSYGGRFENCFPALPPKSPPSYQAVNTATQAQNGSQARNGQVQVQEPAPRQAPQAEKLGGSRLNGMQRQMIRTRFALSRYTGLVTNILVLINVLVYVASNLSPSIHQNIMNWGSQINPYVAQGQYYRIFTAMFLHEDIFHIFINMLSLFMVGRAVEIFYGKGRYLLIYLLSGIGSGIAFYFLDPGQAAVGASGAIFGVFGALGVFYIMNRRMLGTGGQGFIMQWGFILVLNLVLGFTPNSGIAIWGHVGGLIIGMIVAYLVMPRDRRSRRFI